MCQIWIYVVNHIEIFFVKIESMVLLSNVLWHFLSLFFGRKSRKKATNCAYWNFLAIQINRNIQSRHTSILQVLNEKKVTNKKKFPEIRFTALKYFDQFVWFFFSFVLSFLIRDRKTWWLFGIFSEIFKKGKQMWINLKVYWPHFLRPWHVLRL